MNLKIGPFSIFALLVLTQPSWSDQQQTLFDRYSLSVEAVIGTPGKPTNYRSMILNNLSGDWFRISSLAPEKNDPALFARMCNPKGIGAVAIKVLNEYSFEAVSSVSGKTPLSTIFTSRLGNEFGTYSDVSVLIDILGVGSNTQGNAAATRMVDKILGESNGTVSITRPYDDILVFQSRDNPISVWARCSKE